jgi:penicillin-binding protein 1A
MTQGTGGHAIIGCPAAGKTGTTDNNTDAWFVGFTPRLATSVWVGYPKERIQMNGLYYGQNVAGGTFPAEIWGTYMKEAIGKYCGAFKPPSTPFQSSPFFGKYATTGGGKGNELAGGTTDSTTPITPVAPVPAPQEQQEEPEQDTGGRDEQGGDEGGDEGFDPDAYEAPPQPSPDAGTGTGGDAGPDGAVQAPG